MTNLPVVASYRQALLCAHRRRRVWPAILGVLVAGSVGVGVAAAAGTFDDVTDRSAQDMAVSKQGFLAGDRHALSRSYGIELDSARPAFTDSFGRQVLVGSSSQGSCLMTVGDDTCFTAERIALGDGVAVINDCSTAKRSRHTMQISGLVPAHVAQVRVGYSDGGQRSAATVDGAFAIKTTTPQPADPYPTTIDWLNTAGQSLRSAPFPFAAQKLCIPVPPARP